MSRYKIAPFFIAIALLVGCQKEPLVPDNGKVVEGIKTSVRLKLDLPKMDVKTRSILTPEKESEIISLAVFIFDQTGFIVSSAMHESVTAHIQGGAALGQGGWIDIPAISGPQRQIYAIANYDANQIENLKAVASLDDLKQLIVHLYGNPIYREFGMIKVGGCQQDIQVKDTRVSIQLRYASAKITLKVVNKSPDLIVQNWNVGNIPLKTYLLERTYNATNPNLNDAVDHNNDKDFYNDFSDLSFPFDVNDSPGVGTPDGKKYEVSFYLAENRQGTLPLDKRKPLEPPYDGLMSTDYKIKSWDAPKTASYITIIGHQNSGLATQKAILVKHYLGKNAYDNYDVYRGVHYTYTITINNLNEIAIDTNVESYEDPISIDQGADLEAIDSHASFRVFAIHTEAGSHTGAKISAELANFANSTDYPTWLKVSLVPLTSSQIKDPTSSEKIQRWQQPGTDWSYVRTKFIPHSSKRKTYDNPFDTFSFFGDAVTAPKLDSVENPDLIAGANAYPAYDNELPYNWAARRMCNKITDIPIKTLLPTKLYLYADEYEIDGSDERSAVLRITYELNGVKTTRIYKIRQKAPIQFMGLPGDNTIMVVENTEEYAHLLQNDILLNLQMLAGLQWGKYQERAQSLDDGALNTLQGVYETVTNKTNYSVNTYLKKYGGMAGGWSTKNNGEITEGTAKSPLSGGEFYSFYAGTDNDYYNSTYNSTAARYCHEKNWDDNGNGQIDPAEAKWYLPSLRELQLFWTYHEKLKLNTDYYWSSTEADNDNAYAISTVESSSDPRYVYNGTQQKISKVPTIGHNRPRVRCVRRVPVDSNVKRYMPMVIYENKALLIDCSNLTSEMYTTDSKYGLSQNNPGALQKANSKVSKKLWVQLDQPAAVKYSPLHLNGGQCDESKGWRLPTQRELLLIWSVKDRIYAEAGANFAVFKEGLYWTMNRDLTKQYIIDFTTGLSLHANYSLSNSEALNYRCVKEVK